MPAHWDVLPHRSLFEEIKERNHPDEQMLSVTITRGVIRQQELLSDSSKKDSSTRDKSAYKLVCPGDIAYNKMRAWQGAFGVSTLRGIISPAYIVQRLRQPSDPHYFHYLFRTPGFAKEAERWSYGITSDMWSLRPEHFKAIYSPLPPGEEQAAIVRYLDRATRKIDQAIRAKRKIIALLNEQKQAIIHRAVTRGLDHDVPLKESGIPWLGQIPVHWAITKIKRLFNTCSGATPNSGEVDLYYNGPIPWIRTMDLTNGPVEDYFEGITARALADTACKVLPIGTVLIAMYGGAGTIGKNGLLRIQAATNQALCALLPSLSFEPRFVLYFMQYYRPYWMIGADGTRKDPNISQERIRETEILCPALAEQEQIARFIQSETANLQTMVTAIEREIDLLREYRTRLIADVVNGKLDVREAAARLPESAAEEAPEIAEAEDDEEALEEAA